MKPPSQIGSSDLPQEKGVTKRQLRAIWALAHRAGLNEESLHAEVESLSGKRSIRSLTRREAAEVIERLLGGERQGSGVGGQGSEGRRGGFQARPYGPKKEASTAQLSFIGALGTQAGWDPERVLGLARRMYGVKRLQELKTGEASALIEALKAIKNRRAA